MHDCVDFDTDLFVCYYYWYYYIWTCAHIMCIFFSFGFSHSNIFKEIVDQQCLTTLNKIGIQRKQPRTAKSCNGSETGPWRECLTVKGYSGDPCHFIRFKLRGMLNLIKFYCVTGQSEHFQVLKGHLRVSLSFNWWTWLNYWRTFLYKRSK